MNKENKLDELLNLIKTEQDLNRVHKLVEKLKWEQKHKKILEEMLKPYMCNSFIPVPLFIHDLYIEYCDIEAVVEFKNPDGGFDNAIIKIVPQEDGTYLFMSNFETRFQLVEDSYEKLISAYKKKVKNDWRKHNKNFEWAYKSIQNFFDKIKSCNSEQDRQNCPLLEKERQQ